MWRWADEPWQYRVLDALPPSVDPAQIDAALRLSPTERIAALVRLMETADELRDAVARAKSSR